MDWTHGYMAVPDCTGLSQLQHGLATCGLSCQSKPDPACMVLDTIQIDVHESSQSPDAIYFAGINGFVVA